MAAESSSVELALLKEVTPGVTPGSGTWNQIRKNTETLSAPRGQLESGEIRSDGEVASDIQGVGNVGGNIVTELYADGHSELFESALSNTWTNTDTGATTLSAAATGNKFTRATGSFITAGFRAGQWVQSSGFTQAANNGWSKIVSVAALEIVVAGLTLVNETGGGDERLHASILVEGTSPQYYSISKRWRDINEYIILSGCLVSGMTVSMPSEQAVALTFAINGRAESAPASPAPALGAAVSSGDAMTSFSGIVLLDNAVNNNITSFDFNRAVNVRDGFVVGSRSKQHQFRGRRTTTGNISMFVESLLNDYSDARSHIAKDLAVSMSEGSGYFGFTFPRAFLDLELPKVSDDGPQILSGPFRAKFDDTTGVSIIVSRSLA